MGITQKIVATMVGLTMLFSVAVPVAQGTTAEELQAQIATLQAQIKALLAQIAAVGGTPSAGIPAACTGMTFTTNLAQGSTGAIVQCLQALLNTDAMTRLAATGVGSPGNETQYFGPLTHAAVVKFQERYASEILAPLGLTSGTGFVGSMTRAKLNSMLTAPAPTPTPTPTPTPEPETPEPGITTPGVEGSITARYAASPPSGEDVFANSTRTGIVGVEVKATGSDVRVDRIDVNFTGSNSRPWLRIAKIHILDGSTLVKSMDVTSGNTIETTIGSDYTVRVEGLGIVVPKDVTKTINVEIDAILQPGDGSTTLTYKIPANGVRGTDGKGIQQYAPTAGLASRTFIVKSSDRAELEISDHTDNPDQDHNVLVSTSVTTTDVPALVFNIKSKTNASVVREVHVSSTYAADTVMKLYDGNTLLRSASVTSASAGAKFTDLTINIGKNATKSLTVKADIPKQTSVDGSVKASSSIAAASTSIVAEDATTFVSADVTGSDVASGVAYLFDKAPSLALVSAVIGNAEKPSGGLTASNTSEADITIRINVTARGGDIFVAKNASSGIVASTSPEGASTTFVGGDTNTTFSTNATEQTAGSGSWQVTNGSTRYFELTGRVKTSGVTTDPAIFVRAFLRQITWGITDAASNRTAQTWGLTDFKTGERLLEIPN